MKQWSPYAVGVGIGILSWFTFLLSDRPIGCSTAFARTSGMIERLFRGSKVAEKPYSSKKLFSPSSDSLKELKHLEYSQIEDCCTEDKQPVSYGNRAKAQKITDVRAIDC
jgi:hypothetical protein